MIETLLLATGIVVWIFGHGLQTGHEDISKEETE